MRAILPWSITPPKAVATEKDNAAQNALVIDPGLQGRSAPGVRKAAGNLLAQEGCSQYQIMTIHGHTQAQTSEVYTKGVDRWKLAKTARTTLERMDCVRTSWDTLSATY